MTTNSYSGPFYGIYDKDTKELVSPKFPSFYLAEKYAEENGAYYHNFYIEEIDEGKVTNDERFPSKYRKKPVVIEAIRYDRTNWNEICEWMPVPKNGYGDPTDFSIVIVTLEGEMKCQKGDWIIKGVKGEYYPCKDDIFRATYESTISE